MNFWSGLGWVGLGGVCWGGVAVITPVPKILNGKFDLQMKKYDYFVITAGISQKIENVLRCKDVTEITGTQI